MSYKGLQGGVERVQMSFLGGQMIFLGRGGQGNSEVSGELSVGRSFFREDFGSRRSREVWRGGQGNSGVLGSFRRVRSSSAGNIEELGGVDRKVLAGKTGELWQGLEVFMERIV